MATEQDPTTWLRVAFDAIPHCIFAIGPTGRYIYQNAHDRDAFGPLLGVQALDICEPSAALEAWQSAHLAALHGEAVQYVSDRVTHQGLIRAEVFLRPFRIDGVIAGAVGIAVDQTRLINLHEELEASRNQLQDFLTCSSDWVWEQDADFRFLPGFKLPSLNIAGGEGQTRWELAGVSADTDPFWRAHREDLLARREFRLLTYKVRTDDGGERWIETNGRPVFGKDGQFLGYRGTARDVTERQNLVEKFKLAELVVKNTHNAIVICDADHKVSWVNEAFEALSGYASHEIIGRYPADLLVCEETDDATIARVDAALARGEGIRVDLLNRSKSGRNYWIDMDIRPVFNDAGALEGYIAVETDITEKVALREHMRAIFENVPSCVAVFDEAGVVVDCNRAVEKLVALPRDQVVGMRCSDYHWYVFDEGGGPYELQEHPVYRAFRTQAPIEDALIGFDQLGVEGLRWLQGNVTLMRGVDNQPLAIFAFTDITDELKTRDELSRSFAATKRALSELGAYKGALDEHALVFVTNRQHCLEFANARFCQRTGYTFEEIRGQAIGPLINSGLHDQAFYDDMVATVEAGKTWRRQKSNKTRSGEIFWVDQTIIPQRDEHGLITRYVSIAVDITEKVAAEAAMAESERRYRLLADHSSDMIVLGQNDGKRTYFSPSVKRLTGYTPEEALKLGMRDWVHPEDLPALFEATRGLSDAEPTATVTYRLRRKDSSYLWVEQVFSRVLSGDEPYVVASCRDITRRKAIENEYRNVFEHSILGIYRKDLEGRILSANPALVKMRGFEDEASFIQAWDEGRASWHVDQAGKQRRDTQLMADGLIKDFVYQVRSRDKSLMWVSETAWLVRNDQGEPLFIEGMVADVTERIMAEKRLEQQARSDALTGLPNRIAFREHLDCQISEAQGAPLTMLYIDLDRFKAINDSLGHAAGDELLTCIASRLAGLMPPGAHLARLGGDEFAVLLDRSAAETAGEALAVHIIAAVNHAVQLACGYVANVGASVGIARTLPDESDGEQATRRADLAMYQAKRDGRNAYRLYSSAVDDQIKLRQHTETGLREAIALEQFELHFQPVHAVASRKIAGFEALVRWRHPEKGLIPPGLFIPVAEDSGLIVPIGEWVLKAALAEAMRWPSHLRVAINISTVQLRHPDFLGHVMAALTHSPIAPERIEIEVTESALLDDSPATLAVLTKLQQMGLKVALDDFGTGWSSLSYLNRHRFDRIKIDRSFVQGMSDRRNEAIVQTIIDLGERLDVEITAEGVEKLEQLEALARMGCKEAQGWYFGKPLPAADLPFATVARVPQRPLKRYVGGLR